MATRFRFACDFCAARPDPPTQASLQLTLREPDLAPFVDALPGRWLVWRGGGPLGPRRYACDEHRGELTAHLRLHYSGINGCVWERPPYPQIWSDGARRPPALFRPAEGERRPPADRDAAAGIEDRAETTSPFLALTRRPDPSLDDLLLALDRGVSPGRPAARPRAPRRHEPLPVRPRTASTRPGQAGCVAHALRHELGLRPVDARDPETLLPRQRARAPRGPPAPAGGHRGRARPARRRRRPRLLGADAAVRRLRRRPANGSSS